MLILQGIISENIFCGPQLGKKRNKVKLLPEGRTFRLTSALGKGGHLPCQDLFLQSRKLEQDE